MHVNTMPADRQANWSGDCMLPTNGIKWNVSCSPSAQNISRSGERIATVCLESSMQRCKEVKNLDTSADT